MAFSTNNLLTLLMSVLFLQKSRHFRKYSTFTQKDFLVLFSVFPRLLMKMQVLQIMCPEFGFRTAQICQKSKSDNDNVTVCQSDVIVKLFYSCLISLIKFNCLFTGPSFMWISLQVPELWQHVYKGITRNSEIGNIVVWICPISGDWGR